MLPLVYLLGMGCAARIRPDHPQRVDRTVLTRAQMLEGHYSTVYDAVLALHPTWLRPRGPDSFVSPSAVWVYIDDVRAGGVDVLRNIQPGLVNTVRWYDGAQATGRWGVDHGAGVIHVSTWGQGALGFPTSSPDTAPAVGGRWVGTWAASPQLTEPRNMPPAPGLGGSTLRQVVRVSLGGDTLRVRLSNAFGNGPLAIGEVRLAPSLGAGAIVRQREFVVTFHGRHDVTVPPGGAVTSDPLAYVVAPLSDLAITMFVPAAPGDVTGHPGSRTTSYLEAGDHVSADSLPGAARTEHWYLLTGIDVVDPWGAAVVVLGNSIADGRGSGTNRQDRWPDNLARRLHGDAHTAEVAVLNAGIGGNCVLRACLGPAALARLQRDVLDAPGARWVIVSEGVNDIGGAPTPAAADSIGRALVGAYREIIARAHARGLRAYGGTILPFGGSFYDSPARERARQAVNAWIRSSGAFDAVLDLDATMRDPDQPTHLRPDVDSGDHLHPNEWGYQVMADAIDLSLFQSATTNP